MKTHASFPDGRYAQGMVEIKVEVVEQHISQSAAENYAQHDIKKEVGNRLLGNSQMS